VRPLRLALDGFGSYRDATEVDFSGVDFFALTGPTGAGKSTVIDGLCFALYGTVPRWGKENVIRDAMAPSANSCRVCLVFEAAGGRYAAVRLLARGRQGQVQTKEARLARLDPSLPPDAPLTELLQASVAELAEGPDGVTEYVTALLGIGYEHFTQCVLLPQGRFADFLQAKPRDRQGLLVKLLAYGVYEQVGQRARARAVVAANRAAAVQATLDSLTDATPVAEQAAGERLAALTALAGTVQVHVDELAALRVRAEQATAAITAVDAELAQLGAVSMPADVPGLAARIDAAAADVAECAARAAAAEAAESEVEQVRDRLPDAVALQGFRTAYVQRGRLSALLERQVAEHEAAVAASADAAARARAAEDAVTAADTALAGARAAHSAAALAETVHIGQPCPVCLRPVSRLPHHPPPADLSAATAALQTARARRDSAQAAARRAGEAAVEARSGVESSRRQIAELDETLSAAPPPDQVDATLAAIEAADAALAAARRAAKATRRATADAKQARAALGTAEQRAWTALRTARDRLVPFGAPAVGDADGADLRASWQALIDWAAAEHAVREQRRGQLAATATELGAQLTEHAAELSALLAGHGLPAVEPERPERAAVVLAEHRVRAEHHLDAVRQRRAQAAVLAAELAAHREEQQVAELLGNLLKASSFERWLCGEALDVLVAEASATLMDLSGGQYELDRDERNDLTVVDYFDAGTRRPVHTLSGGETFQASLALALALSRQVVSLSAGMRELDSMFLDEGFGTLDEASLETVATTLQSLAEDSGRMVGVVTHVAALAERVPVQFVVSRDGASSRLQRVQV
jgi:DNA repair protein SbcC/Rad50